MKKYEYKIVRYKDEEQLNILGSMGWLICSTIRWEQDGPGEVSHVIFGREIEEKATPSTVREEFFSKVPINFDRKGNCNES